MSNPKGSGPAQATPEIATPEIATPEIATPGPVAGGRRYSGLCSAERALGRYTRLIEAGIDVFGTQGYMGTKIKTLCQSAGLSERYFYESFESREELLTVVYDHLASAMLESVKAAFKAPAKDLMESVKAGMAEVVNFMLTDPRHARIILVEIVGVSPELEAKRHQSLNNFADVVLNQLLLLSGTNPREAHEHLATHPEDQALAAVLAFARLTAVSVVGGVQNMLRDSLLSGTVHNTEAILEVSCQLLNNASWGIRSLTAK